MKVQVLHVKEREWFHFYVLKYLGQQSFFKKKVIGFENSNPFPRQLVRNPLDNFSCTQPTMAWT
jgi:hypothetical protein